MPSAQAGDLLTVIDAIPTDTPAWKSSEAAPAGGTGRISPR